MAKRIKYDRGDINSTLSAAKKIAQTYTVYVYATCFGFTIDKNPAPFGQKCLKVTASNIEKIAWNQGR